MKKLIVLDIILLFVCLLVSCSSSSDPKKSEREKHKGYKELKVYQSYYYKSGEIDKENKLLVRHDIYDREGNVVTRTTMGETGKYENEFNKYNENNMIVESTCFDADDRKYKYTTMKYNEDNIMIEKSIEQYTSFGNIYKEIYEYDDNGNEIFYTYYINDKLNVKTEFLNQYNEKKQLLQTTQLDTEYPDSIKIYSTITTYMYNEHGRIEREFQGNLNTPRIRYITYLYDKNGNKIFQNTMSMKRFYYDTWIDTWNYKYNNKGFLIEEQYVNVTHEGEQSNRIIKYKYNNKDLIIEKTYFNKQGEPEDTYIYEYK